MDFAVEARIEGDLRIVAARGELDLQEAPGFAAVLLPEVEAGSHVIVDLSGLSFIDSSGLAVIVRASTQAREVGARVELVASTERVLKVLRITGLDSLIPLHDSLESAKIAT
jgi:anti-sigma B factor antagonist